MVYSPLYLLRISGSRRSTWRCWICTQTRCRVTFWLPRLLSVSMRQRLTREDGPPAVRTDADVTHLTRCFAHSVLLCSWSSWPQKSGNAAAALEVIQLRARMLPHIGACQNLSLCSGKDSDGPCSSLTPPCMWIKVVQHSTPRCINAEGLGPNTWRC